MGAESYSNCSVDNIVFTQRLPAWLHWKQKHAMKPRTRALQRFRQLRGNQNAWLTVAEIERKVIDAGVDFPVHLRLWTGSAY
jgi:hypothetical protein